MVSLKENCRQSEDLVYAELLNRIRIGNHSSEDLEVLSKRVCGTGHPFDQECAITENATVLCSKHEYKDVINEQLLSTLPSEVIECHASDSDCSGAPLNKFQTAKLNQSKSAPPQVVKLKCGARVVITRNIDVAGGVVNGTIGTIENIQPNLITVRRLKDNELMCITMLACVTVQTLPLGNSFL